MRELSKIKLGSKTYFVDTRLGEIRNAENPHDAEGVSPELIDFWERRVWLDMKK